jgi:dynein heavy chain
VYVALVAALEVHAQVAITFRKTAAHCHYEFHLHHLSNLFQGLLLSSAASVDTPTKIVALWMHESARVYRDRLVSAADVTKYNSLVQRQLQKHFPAMNFQHYFAIENPEPLLFCPVSALNRSGAIQDDGYDQVSIYVYIYIS